MKKISLTLATLLFSSLLTFAQTWTQKASIPTSGKRSPVCSRIGTKVYAGLGVTSGNVYTKDFWEYNIPGNTWTQKTNYPGAGSNDNTSFALNGKVYVGLGFSGSYACQKDFWEYNPVTNTWTQKADFPGAARFGARAFVIGDSAFVVAGSTNNGNDYQFDLYMYNPATNTWKQKADFPGSKRAWGAAFVINGMGYYGCGLYDTYTETKDFWKYNPVTNAWSAIPDFPGTARGAPLSFVINDQAYVGYGGNSTSTALYNNFGIYNPATNSWSTMVMPAQVPTRTGAMAFSYGNVGFIGLGITPSLALSDLWSFGGFGDLQGVVSYDNTGNTPLSGVTLQLKQGNTVVNTTLTNNDGFYSFTTVPAGNYTIHCTSVSPWGGVNATDALYIAQHFVGFMTLTGLRYKAADVNVSISVNAIDSQLCAKRFVMIINSFTSGDWLFEESAITKIAGTPLVQNVKGICYGDVNGSFIPPN